MSMKLKKKFKKSLGKVQTEKAKVQIGKNGLSQKIFTELSNQLKLHSLIKVRFMNNYVTDDIKADIDKITKRTKSKLVDKRGRTIIIYKPKVAE
ncbi:MAG: YhbY family RNA-binding protein [Candidatus Heimdallarchaeota archaeon]